MTEPSPGETPSSDPPWRPVPVGAPDVARVRAERRAVRAGIGAVVLAGLVAIVCAFLPGVAVYENNRDQCARPRLDLFGHGGGGAAAPCEVVERYVGTRPAGDAGTVIVVLLALAPAALVWQRPRAGAALGWGILLWACVAAYSAYAILTYESPGCGPQTTRLETLWPTRVLGWCTVAVAVGPFAVALAGVVAHHWPRRPPPRIPTAVARRR